MKATELMIGDWVNLSPGDYPVQNYVKIHAIDYDYQISKDYVCDIAFLSTGAIQYNYSMRSLKPIPLTAEILEKNGFIKDAYKDDRLTDAYHLIVPTGFERNSFTIQVSLYKEPICGVSTLVKCWGRLPPYNGGMNDIHLCSANYVHELQHALKLCGINKEIAL